MSFRAVVINSTARKAIVTIASTKSLAEVLAEACSKFHVDASEHGLKFKNKQLDLSLPIHLSGLRSGVKLDLVRVPRSSSVVSVALQLPEPEARSVPNGRLTDTFQSNNTLWLVLRKFEDAAARNGTTMNLTSRGVPSTNAEQGRLVHQFPVIQILGRELLSFTDLQKTLAELGFNSGSILLRLNFRTTDRPFEEAMVEIEEYFKSVAAELSSLQPVDNSNGESPALPTPEENTPKSTPLSTPSNTDITPEQSTPEPSITQPATSEPAISEPPAATLVSSRPTTVYAPPTNATPQAAQLPYNEEDYEQSMDIVAIQREQLRRARETRLPSNAELEARAAAQVERLANVREVEIKVRFPDQSQVVSKFSQQDSTESLYCFVRSCLDHAIADEKFTLSYFTSRSRALAGKTIIPDSPDKRIIRDLGMEGRVLVNFSWSDEASPTARSSSTQILRVELRQVASQIVVEDYPDLPADEEAKKKEKEKDKGREEEQQKEKEEKKEQKVRSIMQRFGVGGGGGGGDQGKKSGGSKKGPSWMNLPGKK